MKLPRRLGALILAALALVLGLSGCVRSGDNLSLRVCVGAVPGSLDPIYAETEGDLTILNHLYENLMRYTTGTDGQPALVNGMAKTVDREIHRDGTITCTFRLRSARWSDGRSVRASDFVYAWRRLADPASRSPHWELLSMVEGFQEARNKGDMTLLQVTAKNESTLTVRLTGRYETFLSQVCTSPAAVPLREDVVQRLKTARGAENAKWWSDPTALVTNGPYAVEKSSDGELTLAVSDRYTGEEPGPRRLVFRFSATGEQPADLYTRQEADAAWPLTDSAAEEGRVSVPELSVNLLVFNCAGETFADPVIRQAMILDVNRTALAQAARGQAAEGLVPPGVPENGEGDFRTQGGAVLSNDTAFWPDRQRQARALLEDAGYEGAALGELEYLYSRDTAYAGSVARILCDEWQETLGIQVSFRAVSREELNRALAEGDFTLANLDFAPAGNDPEYFLLPWRSGSTGNLAGYENSAFDALCAVIAGAADSSARLGCLHDAEELFLADGALTPLYTRETAWALRPPLIGALRDGRGWFNFAGVYLRPV